MLASVEVAESRRARRRGLLGRDGVDGAMLLPGARSVHTFGMRFAIDVAFVSAEVGDESIRRVLDVRTMKRNRLSPVLLSARGVLEAEAGEMARWDLSPGDLVAIR